MFSVWAGSSLLERFFYSLLGGVCRTTLTPIANYAFFPEAAPHSSFAVQSPVVVQ